LIGYTGRRFRALGRETGNSLSTLNFKATAGCVHDANASRVRLAIRSATRSDNGRGGRLVGSAELSQDRLDVISRGGRGDIKIARYLLMRKTDRDLFGNLAFTPGQRFAAISTTRGDQKQRGAREIRNLARAYLNSLVHGNRG
jgi:hypothetical protein